jgi:hypothetical protein
MLRRCTLRKINTVRYFMEPLLLSPGWTTRCSSEKEFAPFIRFSTTFRAIKEKKDMTDYISTGTHIGTMLAEMGEHQLTILCYLRHSNLHVTNKCLQATSKTKRSAQEKLVEAIMPTTGFLPKPTIVQ